MLEYPAVKIFLEILTVLARVTQEIGVRQLLQISLVMIILQFMTILMDLMAAAVLLAAPTITLGIITVTNKEVYRNFCSIA